MNPPGHSVDCLWVFKDEFYQIKSPSLELLLWCFCSGDFCKRTHCAPPPNPHPSALESTFPHWAASGALLPSLSPRQNVHIQFFLGKLNMHLPWLCQQMNYTRQILNLAVTCIRSFQVSGPELCTGATPPITVTFNPRNGVVLDATLSLCKAWPCFKKQTCAVP